MFEIIPCFVRVVCAFPRLDVVFEHTMPVKDDKGEVYCLTLSQLCFGVSCVFNQVVYGVEYDVNWLGWVVYHYLDGCGLVVKLLRGDASTVGVEELKNGQDK